MELIRKIKDAENQASQIIDQAKAQTIEQNEKFRTGKQEKLEQAELERKKAIDQAIAKAETKGKVEAEKLHAQGQTERDKLRKKVSPKIPAAAAKVMGYLKG